MSPKWSNLVLTADIPDCELNVLIVDRLDVKAYMDSLFSTVQILDVNGLVNVPIVGIVVTISPSFSLYRIVVLPAASRPTIKMRISFLPHSLSKSFEKETPMLVDSPVLMYGCSRSVEKVR